MKIQEFNNLKKYSEASGTICIIDRRFKNTLNKYGYYEEITKANPDDEMSENALFVSPNFNIDFDETLMSKNLFSNVESINFDSKIGYYLSLFAGHVKEGNFRENGSSGGMGTWLLQELFRLKYIDGVIHVKKSNNGDLPLFKYTISTTLEEIALGSKTKYYPVELSEVLDLIKNKPGKYAMIGIPSFVYSVRLLSEKDDFYKNSIKFYIGLVCGHQKSSKYSEYLAYQLGVYPGDIKDIDYRKKDFLQASNYYSIEIDTFSKGKVNKKMHNLLGNDWGQGYFKVFASDFTDDVLNETADVTLGDAWLPNYSNDGKGNNIVIVRNPIINDLVMRGISENRLKLDRVDKNTIISSQAAHFRHTQNELSYRLHKESKKSDWIPKKRVPPTSSNIPLLRRMIQDLRMKISTFSHIKFAEVKDDSSLKKFNKFMGKYSRKYKFLYSLILIQNKGIKTLIKSIKRKIFENPKA